MKIRLSVREKCVCASMKDSVLSFDVLFILC